MKTKIFFSIVFTIAIAFQTNAQIKVLSNGNIGLGTSTPTQQIDMRGIIQMIPTGSNFSLNISSYQGASASFDPQQVNTGHLGIKCIWFDAYINEVHYTTLIHMSDEKLKENIGGINNALSKIKKIKGVKYDYKKGFLNSPIDSLNKYSSSYSLKNQFGFIAQQIDSVVPEVVVYDSIHKNYGVSYENLIPVIVEAIKEQQLQIDSLKQLVNKKNPGTLKNAKEIYSVEEAGSEKTSSLEQNSPNPFNQNTTIAYYLPETIKNAAIYIYNMQGNQIKVIPVNANGNGSITIYGSELRPGMYLYSLIADGKEVDTKRMILTE